MNYQVFNKLKYKSKSKSNLNLILDVLLVAPLKTKNTLKKSRGNPMSKEALSKLCCAVPKLILNFF